MRQWCREKRQQLNQCGTTLRYGFSSLLVPFPRDPYVQFKFQCRNKGCPRCMALSLDPLKDSKYALVCLLVDDGSAGCDYMFECVFRNNVRNERCVPGKCIKLTVACVL